MLGRFLSVLSLLLLSVHSLPLPKPLVSFPNKKTSMGLVRATVAFYENLAGCYCMRMERRGVSWALGRERERKREQAWIAFFSRRV